MSYVYLKITHFPLISLVTAIVSIIVINWSCKTKINTVIYNNLCNT